VEVVGADEQEVGVLLDERLGLEAQRAAFCEGDGREVIREGDRPDLAFFAIYPDGPLAGLGVVVEAQPSAGDPTSVCTSLVVPCVATLLSETERKGCENYVE